MTLTTVAVGLLMRLSLWDECRMRIERALAEGEATLADQATLHSALSATLLNTAGPQREVGVALRRTLDIAERIGDTEHRLRALWGLSSYHRSRGDHRRALSFAERCRDAAAETGDKADELLFLRA